MVVVLLLIAITFTLQSCKISDDIKPHELGNMGISVYTEMIKVDLEYGSENLGFPLYFVSDKPLAADRIELVRLEGENIDYFEKTILTRRQITDVTDVEINGKYLYLYNVDSFIDYDYFTTMTNTERPDIWEIRIDAVVVNIDDKEYSIVLKNPVRYHYNDDGYNDIDGNHMYGPIVVFTYGLTETYSVNIHNYTNSIKVKDLYFSDFLDVQNKQLYYQGIYLGELTGEKLYNVNQRSDGAASGALIYFNASPSKEYTSSEFDYILCTTVVEYQIDGDDAVYKMKFPFNAQGIGNRETAENFLDYIDGLE